MASQQLESDSTTDDPNTRTYWREPLGHVVRLAQVEADTVHWLSPGRLAAGKLTILDGNLGLGKSMLLCEFAARLTRGNALPSGQSGSPRGVLLMSAEDDLFDTILPRIDAAGGDPGRVFTLSSFSDELGTVDGAGPCHRLTAKMLTTPLPHILSILSTL